MARPQRNNVDYFPFLCNEGSKMFYLEETYGNDGFATFIKILRELASTEFHYLDLSKNTTRMFLSAKCKVNKETLEAIICDLVELGKFDGELWKECSVIWCQDFIDSIQDAYIKRTNDCIDRNGLLELLISLGVRKPPKKTPKQPKRPSKEPVNPQSIVENTILNYIKEKEIVLPFESKEFLDNFVLWAKYRSEIKKKIHDGAISLQGQLNKIKSVSKNNEKESIRIINNCINNKWIGIQDHPEKQKQTFKPHQFDLSQVDYEEEF